MTDQLESGRDPWQRPRWLLPLLVVLALIGGVTWVVLDRRDAAAAAERKDRPYIRMLAELQAGLNGAPTSRQLQLSLSLSELHDQPGAAPVDTSMRVLRIALEGASGQLHGIVHNHFVGTGMGPDLRDLQPFEDKLDQLSLTLTFDPPIQCGHAVPGSTPPLLLTVELPSGKHITQRVPILKNYGYAGRDGKIRNLPWPEIMAQMACDRPSR